MSLMNTLDGEVGRADHGGATASGIDMTVGTAHINVKTGETETFEGGSELGEMIGILAPDLGDDRRIGGGDF